MTPPPVGGWHHIVTFRRVDDAINQRRERRQRVAFFGEISVPVIVLSDRSEAVAQHHFGVIVVYTGTRQQRPRAPSQVVDPPTMHVAGRVELLFDPRIESSVERKNMGASGEPRLSVDDFDRHRRQQQHASVALLARQRFNVPDASVEVEVIPFHADDFVAALAGQQQQLDVGTERAGIAGGTPHPPDLVVIEHPTAFAGLGINAVHAGDERDGVIVVPFRKPTGDRAQNRQHGVGLEGAVVILDVVDQLGDVAAADVDKLALTPNWGDIALDDPAHLTGGAQLALFAAFDVALQPAFAYFGDAVLLDGRRRERRVASFDAPDDLPGNLTSLFNLHLGVGTDTHPFLTTTRITSDDAEGGSRWPDAHVMLRQLRIGIRRGARWLLRDHLVGQHLAALAALAALGTGAGSVIFGGP